MNDTSQYIPILHTPQDQPASHLHTLLRGNHYQLMSMGESSSSRPTKMTQFTNKSTKKRQSTRAESSLESRCTDKQTPYVPSASNETVVQSVRRQKIKRKLDSATAITASYVLISSNDDLSRGKSNCSQNSENMRNSRQVFNDINNIRQAVCKFEEEHNSYSFNTCKTCQDKKIYLKLHNGECLRCCRDKNTIKMFSKNYYMDSGPVPEALSGLSIVE